MIKVKYSTNYRAVLIRISRLPKMYEETIEAGLKRDAVAFIKTYQAGLEDDTFRLERLTEATINRKRSKGMAKPRAPLYGRGKTEDNSLYNLLLIRKIKNGYRVAKRKAKHHTSELALDHLHAVHENGALIESRGNIIRIPKRPALAKTRRRFFRELRERTSPEVVQQAVGFALKTGSMKKIRAEVHKADREARDHAARN